ncbi:hypothetical protein EC973_006433 [Apophysomyces ossiformis]|uniref:Uncharacterized protein n=1 Tax=Apophysomyces ossiformis TaxID=679940 RepID=A0A8H7BTD8_9FUNG|nr:hypothetical protein EC973_006433 [Apophysomyces ossiformis]
MQELASLAKERGFTPTATASLADICARVLRRRLPKEKSVCESNWEGSLSSAQLNYATLYASMSLKLFSRMSTVPAAAQILDNHHGLQPGLPVTLLSDNCIRLVAYDIIFNGRTVTKSRLVIDIERILAPGAVLQLTGGNACDIDAIQLNNYPSKKTYPKSTRRLQWPPLIGMISPIEPDTNLSYALDYDIDDTPSEKAEEDESESESEEFADQELDTSVIDIDNQKLDHSLLDPIFNKA